MPGSKNVIDGLMPPNMKSRRKLTRGRGVCLFKMV